MMCNINKNHPMKKYVFILSAFIVTTLWICEIHKEEKLSSLLLMNVEALAGDNPEKVDCSFDREEGKCEIFVGAKGEVRIGGASIIKADANGYVKFDGKVVCSKPGNKSCTPIECKDLYEVIF